MDKRLRPRERLRGRAAFAHVFARRCRASDGLLVVHVTENGLDFPRLGISVSKRIGNAAVRNYAKRRLREAFRCHKAELTAGLDHVYVVRRDLHDEDVVGSLRTLSAKAARQLLKQARDAQPKGE